MRWWRRLRERFGDGFEALAYADTGPLQERIFAKHAGIGWIGKNTLVLNQQMGSWFFLGAVLTTLELTPSLEAAEAPPADLCGSCTRCIDACPTDALIAPYEMDARRCISYLTIEHRGAIPAEFREAIGNHVYGCDICQDVCPWNRRAPVTSVAEFQPRDVWDAGLRAAGLPDGGSRVAVSAEADGACGDQRGRIQSCVSRERYQADKASRDCAECVYRARECEVRTRRRRRTRRLCTCCSGFRRRMIR